MDVVIGVGRKEIFADARTSGKDLNAVAQQHHRPTYSSLAEVPAGTRRPLVVQGKPGFSD